MRAQIRVQIRAKAGALGPGRICAALLGLARAGLVGLACLALLLLGLHLAATPDRLQPAGQSLAQTLAQGLHQSLGQTQAQAGDPLLSSKANLPGLVAPPERHPDAALPSMGPGLRARPARLRFLGGLRRQASPRGQGARLRPGARAPPRGI